MVMVLDINSIITIVIITITIITTNAHLALCCRVHGVECFAEEGRNRNYHLRNYTVYCGVADGVGRVLAWFNHGKARDSTQKSDSTKKLMTHQCSGSTV
jgi:hypothetical protein